MIMLIISIRPTLLFFPRFWFFLVESLCYLVVHAFTCSRCCVCVIVATKVPHLVPYQLPFGVPTFTHLFSLQLFKYIMSGSSVASLDLDKRCNNRGCRSRPPTEKLISCQNASCGKVFHLRCFQERFKVDTLPLPKLRDDQVICTKACYNKLSNPPRLNWTNDGKDGTDDPDSSERILLDWLMFPGNYNNKWRGKDNKGRKKKHIAMEIAQIINDAGVLVKRDHKQVRNKIQHLERQFREAYDFANTETGAGLMTEDKVVFDEAVMQKCPNYFDVLEIFADRASSKPRATNMDNSLASSESDTESVSSVEEKNNNKKQNGSGSASISSLSNLGKKSFQSTFG